VQEMATSRRPGLTSKGTIPIQRARCKHNPEIIDGGRRDDTDQPGIGPWRARVAKTEQGASQDSIESVISLAIYDWPGSRPHRVRAAVSKASPNASAFERHDGGAVTAQKRKTISNGHAPPP